MKEITPGLYRIRGPGKCCLWSWPSTRECKLVDTVESGQLVNVVSVTYVETMPGFRCVIMPRNAIGETAINKDKWAPVFVKV